MRTIIRMQRKGPKNIYTNRMVVQGSYKKLKGMVIENLGYWVFKRLDEHKASIILNRNRARYWLAMGALLSPKVQRWFCAWNLACPQYIKWGKSTAVTHKHDQEAAAKKGLMEYMTHGQGYCPASPAVEGQSNALSARNVYFRQIKFREQIKNYLDPQNQADFLESIVAMTPKEVENNTPFERSLKFYELKRLYDQIEQDPTRIAPYKRELLYNRMNELAERGLMSESQVEEAKQKLLLDEGLDPVERSFMQEWEDRKRRSQRVLASLEAYTTPIEKTEFMARAKEQSNLPPPIFQEKMTEYLAASTGQQKPYTLMDVEYFVKVYCTFDSNLEESRPQLDSSLAESYIPPKIPITPEPEMHLYDPNDWYDLRGANTSEIRNYASENDRWFDLPLSEARDKEYRDRTYNEVAKGLREKSSGDSFSLRGKKPIDELHRKKIDRFKAGKAKFRAERDAKKAEAEQAAEAAKAAPADKA